MAQQQQQGGGGGGSGNTDNSMAVAWIMVLLFITAYLIWRFGHAYIVGFVFEVSIWEAKLVNLFLRNPALSHQITLMQTVDRAGVTWDQLNIILTDIGEFLRYPFAGIFLILAMLLYRSNITMKYRKTHNMKTLKQQEQANWPAIMPTLKEDLVNTDLDKGPWAMALTPMEFARKYHLLRKDDAILDPQTPGKEMTAGIRRADAKRVFTMQLGPYWESFDRCPPHVIALAAIFCARINRDAAASTHLLKSINRSFAAGKADFSIAKPVLKKYYRSELVQEVLARHAYLLTVMGSLLEASRDDGVVATAEFLWLKPIDRRLWYMLNSMGRQTPFSEIGGAFAHWRAEKELGRRCLVPMVDEAIKALEVAVKEVRLTPRQMQELLP